jgi:anti-anti-sigma factor
MPAPYQLIDVVQEDGIPVVNVLCQELRGDSVISQLEQELDDYLQATRCSGLVLNLSAVHFMTSNGLRALIVLRRKMRQMGGRFTMCGVHPHVASVFKTTRLFSEKFDYMDDVASAITALKSQA